MLLTYTCLPHAQQLVQRALGGESDRSLKFGRDQGMWLFNGRGWDTNDNLGEILWNVFQKFPSLLLTLIYNLYMCIFKGHVHMHLHSA
jgi:hypothetical protein